MDVDDVGVAAEHRAGDLIERLADCGLDDGLNEEDLFGSSVREPFRALCGRLARKVWQLAGSAGESTRAAFPRLRGAVNAVENNVQSEDAAGGGRLDRSLTRVARSLNPASKAAARVDVLEELVQYLQAALVLRAASADAGAGAPDAPSPMEGVEGPPASGAGDAGLAERSALARSLAALLGADCAARGEQTLAACARKLDQSLKVLPASHVQPLLRRESFGPAQLERLAEVRALLTDEYTIRRQTLSKRAAVTLQSLQHSSRIKKDQSEVSPACQSNSPDRAAPRARPLSPSAFGAAFGSTPPLHTHSHGS